jgi:hypothetical protein
MSRVLAIASISLRTAIRSKVVLGMLAVLLLVIVALPLTIKGDGTLAGEVQVMLTYTLGIILFILSVLTLWAGCAAISFEIAEKQIHLVVSKPVYRYQIWLGKWLGLLCLNAVLLAVSGATIYGLLRWNTRPALLEEAEQQSLREEILVARRVVMPELEDFSTEARAMVEERFKDGDLPPNTPRSELQKAAEQSLIIRRYTAPQGASLDWTIQLPRSARIDLPMQFTFKFSSSDVADRVAIGTWRITAPDRPGVVEVTQPNTPNAEHTIRLPGKTAGPQRRLEVQYINAHPEPVAVLFPPESIAVLAYAGSFEANFGRTLFALFCHLAFLGAVGVTAGSLFSMPVAAFVSLFTMVLLKFIPYIESMAGRDVLAMPAPDGTTSFNLLGALVGLIFQVLSFVVSPLQTASPLEALGIGHLIPWSLVGNIFAIKVVIYCGLFGVIGSWLFNRRELGLPS